MSSARPATTEGAEKERLDVLTNNATQIIYTCEDIHTYPNIYTYTYIYIHIYTHIYIYTYINIYM